MAITTLDGALAGMQTPRPFAKAATGSMVAGRPWSTWALAGNPGAGSFDTTLAGAALSSSSSMVNGQLPHVNPGSGEAYLAGLTASATQAGLLLLCDRLRPAAISPARPSAASWARPIGRPASRPAAAIGGRR